MTLYLELPLFIAAWYLGALWHRLRTTSVSQWRKLRKALYVLTWSYLAKKVGLYGG